MKVVLSLITISYFFYLFLRLLNLSQISLFHQDEHEFVRRSIYFDLLVKGQFDHYLWQDFTAYDAQQLPHYLFGLALYAQGYKQNMAEKLKENDFWYGIDLDTDDAWRKNVNWWVQYDEDHYKGFSDNLPLEIREKAEPIYKARIAVVLLSTGTLIFIFLLGKSIKNHLLGIILSLFLFNNFFFKTTASRVMAEAPLLFFLTSILLISHSFALKFQKISTFSKYFFSLVIGLLIGCAVSSKLTGIFAIPFYLILLYFLIFHTKQNLFKKIRSLISILAINVIFAFISFITLNPFTWKSPIERTEFIINFQQEKTHKQQNLIPGDALFSPGDKAKSIFKEFFLPREGHPTFLIYNIPIDLILAISGILLTVKIGYKKYIKDRKINSEIIIMIWGFIWLIGSYFYLPLAWYRYYLPLILPVIIFESYGVYCLLISCFNFLKVSYEKLLP